MTPIEITSDYAIVLVSSLALVFHFFGLGPWGSMGFRKPLFTKKFIEEKMGAVQKECGRTVGGMGYPDYGCGRLADQLDYKDWYTFNAAMRVGQNTLGLFGPILVTTLIFGLFRPYLAAFGCLMYLVSRVLYAKAYVNGQNIEMHAFIGFGLIAFNAVGGLACLYSL